ncbi:MAG: FAD-dependent oxidoreductase, partial [Gammaproteobacteria bacterium]|nr:FAD-dependent oxidoreductase [Gammaproteobacteria bacterium]
MRINIMAKLKVDIGVIGAGSGGLSIAAVASQMGANVALLERDKMGGDCLNSGCVPSKSLLAAARRAEIIRHAKDFGIQVDHFNVDYKKVQEHVHNVIATIAPHDSVERFSGLGVNVIEAPGHFIGPREVEAGDTTIQAKWWVVATGSKAIVPPIPGLEDTPFLTNETIFTVAKPPTKLIVIGGGPIGCEMAQAHRMLGIEVVILELFSILPKDDQDCTAVVRKRFQEQGIDIVEGIKIKNV